MQGWLWAHAAGWGDSFDVKVFAADVCGSAFSRDLTIDTSMAIFWRREGWHLPFGVLGYV